ncbi:MAG: hypothetical protein AMQ74_00338 [Candidatus Methanofastidiosum methylothiophilum]|uniref:Uncharacterized protein n=1 Tax=Candidatus Methanofastidiosum methylothiophilum TaxID=1705564 RepID=A0A150J8X3_9EURY|nr:MAG: hypothetical protein AMQ74_00338 [Candidatus Methanofastidiosum methylthiophilus]
MTIYTEFECGRLPKRKDIISNLISSGYTVSYESKQELSIKKMFQEGNLIFSKHKVMLKINLNIFFLLAISLFASLTIFYISYFLVKSDAVGISTFYYLTIISILSSLVVYELFRDRLLLSIEKAVGQKYRVSWKNFLSIIAILLFSIAYFLINI